MDGFSRAKWFILFVAVCTVGYRFAQSAALKQVETGIVIAIKRMSALIIVALSGEFFHEKNLLKKIIASVIMIAGILLLVL